MMSLNISFFQIQIEKHQLMRTYLMAQTHVIINKMHSPKKEGQELVKKIKDEKETLLFGISFSRPPSTLALYKQHLYSLYLLLYKYGEKDHKSRLINRMNKYLTELSIKVDRHAHKCISSDFRLECIENKRILGLLQIFNFAKEDLAEEMKQIAFHNQKQRKKFRKMLKYTFQEEGRPFERQYMNLFDYARLTGSLIGLDCQIREFYNFQLVEFKCECFDDNNVEVFIEIDRVSNTYRYIKQRKMELFFTSDKEYEKMAAMKHSLYTTDAYNNMRYVESQTQGIEINNFDDEDEVIESVVAVSKECSMEESAMVEEQQEEAMLESNVLVSRKSNPNRYKGVQFQQIDKSSVQDGLSGIQAHDGKEEAQLLQSVAYVVNNHKSSKNNTMVVSQESKQQGVLQEQSFTERFDVDKQLLKIEVPSAENLKINKVRKVSYPPIEKLEEDPLFKIVESRMQQHDSKKVKFSKEKKAMAFEKAKIQEEFQNNYVVKRQFLDELFDQAQQNQQTENFVIALHKEVLHSHVENTSSIIEEKHDKNDQKNKVGVEKQQNLLSTKDSKKPPPRVKQQKECLGESSKTIKQTINFKKSRRAPLINSRSIQKPRQSQLMKKTQSKVLQVHKIVPQNLKKQGNPQNLLSAPVEQKKQNKVLIHSKSSGNIIRLSREKNIGQTYKYSSRLTIHRESSLGKTQYPVKQIVSK